MITTHRIHRLVPFGPGLLLLALGAGCGGEEAREEAAEAAPATILSRVEALAPATDSARFEVYERQLEQNTLVQQSRAAGVEVPAYMQERPLPPTLTDVLMHDFWMTANTDLGMGVLPQTVTEAQMSQIIAFYVATPDTQIRGYRPRTHKAFIVGLSEAERTQLARESAAWVNEHGWLGPPL